MHKIIPHLWYDTQAKEAARLYTGLFPGSRITSTTTLSDTPSGDAQTVSFELAGLPFQAISAGPYFSLNPSISFMVSCSAAEEVDALWNVLADGGQTLMPLGEYPFSRRYGWVQDRYGLTWQLMQLGEEQVQQVITPNLLFSGDVCGQAEEAARFYAEVFPDSSVGLVSRYGEGEAPVAQAKANFISFTLCGQSFTAMDNGHDAGFGFNEALSFMVQCKDQAEIDYYWDKLSAVPEAEQCGWLKDKYGLSWQIVPEQLDRMMAEGTSEEIKRVTKAFLGMKKFDLAALQAAWLGE
ncbi:MAG: hypothetical protein K0Q90_2820 [Paenibacillaceae bacterium]|jgi:predicted 3-demethylubiquinone-9 3-methyltransferase (glyoxalase superfamily)|nr:hypothetical protein [Paenibacillaceae bacterium]